MKPEGWMLGERVELHPGTDAWMRGDRYGEVVGVGRKWLRVLMDWSGRTLRVSPDRIGNWLGKAA